MAQVTGVRRLQLPSEDSYNINFPPNNAWVMKSRKLISAGYVVRMHRFIVFNDAVSSSSYAVRMVG